MIKGSKLLATCCIQLKNGDYIYVFNNYNDLMRQSVNKNTTIKVLVSALFSQELKINKNDILEFWRLK